MKLFKRIVATTTLVVIAVGSLVACKSGKSGDSEETKAQEQEKIITLDCYSQLSSYMGIQQGWFAELLKKKFNVEINICVERGKTYEEMLTEGDLGDIIVFAAPAYYHNAIEAGVLLDWEADGLLEQYGKDITENHSAALEYNRDISDGVIYGIGNGTATSVYEHDPFFHTWNLRYDYYEEIGCPEIKNLDDLVVILEQIKANHPVDDNGNETYAVSLWPDWDEKMQIYAAGLVTAYYGYDQLGLGHYNCETGEFYDALTVNDDGTYGPYIEMLQFLNKLYQKGLLDPDSKTMEYSKITDKMAQGTTFWTIFNYAGSEVFNTEENLEAGKAMYPVVPEDARPCAYGLDALGDYRIISIGANTKYPEKCMEIINWMCSPDGDLECKYGPQGLMWYYGDDGLTHFTELGKTSTVDYFVKMESDDEEFADYSEYKYKDGMSQINWLGFDYSATNPKTGERFDYRYWKSMQTEAEAGSIEAKWRDWANAATAEEYLENRDKYVVSIDSSYVEGTKDTDLTAIWTQVSNAIVEGSWNAIMSASDAEFEANIQSMIALAKSYSNDNGNGYEQCIEWCEKEAANRKSAEDKIK